MTKHTVYWRATIALETDIDIDCNRDSEIEYDKACEKAWKMLHEIKDIKEWWDFEVDSVKCHGE